MEVFERLGEEAIGDELRRSRIEACLDWPDLE